MTDPTFDAPGVADFYDELPLWSAPFGQLILDRVPLVDGQAILDLGAGTGFLSIELAQRSGRRSQIIAVDPWVTAMNRLERKLEHLGLSNVALHRRDAVQLDLADQSVDVVVSNLGVNNFVRPDDVLRECRRVLRADGTMLVSSNLVGHMAEFYDAFAATLVELDLPLAPLDEHIAHRADVAGLTAMLQRAGFEVADVATTRFTMRYANGTALLEHAFVKLGFLPAWQDVVPVGRRDDVFAAIERRLTDPLTLTIPAACLTAHPGRPTATLT